MFASHNQFHLYGFSDIVNLLGSTPAQHCTCIKIVQTLETPNTNSMFASADPMLADELNTFYGRLECNGGRATLPISAAESSRQSSDDHVITVSEDEVRRELKRVNISIIRIND